MKVGFFDAHGFERAIFEELNAHHSHSITFFETRLTSQSVSLAHGFPALCVFANDKLDGTLIRELSNHGLRLLALRSAGFNHVDVKTCHELGIKVLRVPAYSPHAVAEHALCLLLALNRKIHRSYARVRELNFSLEGLVGFDLAGKTVGVIGTGKIGSVFCKIMKGLGCTILAFDVKEDESLKKSHSVTYLPLEELYRRSDIVSLHVPLTAQTKHMIDEAALAHMKPGVFLINTGRGALLDTKALIGGLKSGHIGAAGLDVYEEEEGVFFYDLSNLVLQDDILARLLTFPNVLITAHQAFLTREALLNIAATTLKNISDFECGASLENEVTVSL